MKDKVLSTINNTRNWFNSHLKINQTQLVILTVLGLILMGLTAMLGFFPTLLLIGFTVTVNLLAYIGNTTDIVITAYEKTDTKTEDKKDKE